MTEEVQSQVQEPQGEPTEEPPAYKEPTSTRLIDKANAAAERLEKATAALAKENTRREQLKVERMLGGESVTPDKQEESASEYAQKALRGELNESEKER